MERQPSRAGPLKWARWAGVAAIVGAVALAIAVVSWPRSTVPAVAVATPTAAPVAPASPTDAPRPPQIGLCIEAYSLETLANRSFAFDGTVTAIDDELVTFRINRAFRGVSGPSVVLTAQGVSGSSIIAVGGARFELDKRYLVSGEERIAWGCDFSQPYDPALAEDWARTFNR